MKGKEFRNSKLEGGLCTAKPPSTSSLVTLPCTGGFLGARLVRRLPIIVGLVGVVAVVASIAGIAVEETEDYGEDIEHPLSAFFCHSRPRCL